MSLRLCLLGREEYLVANPNAVSVRNFVLETQRH